MNIFSSPRELALLDAHEEEGVRRIAQDVRTLASEVLLARMEHQSRDRLGEHRHRDLPRFLWRAMRESTRIEEADAHELDLLSRLCDGWWVFDGNGGAFLVTLAEWGEM